MPVMNGFDAAQFIINHKAENASKINIVALTSYTDESTKVKS